MTAASGIGSMPGDPVEAQRAVVGELSGPSGTDGIPFLVEAPGRGPGADLTGRTAALLVDLPVDLQPHGWRLVDGPGRDLDRARAMLRADLDALAEAADGYTGALKIQAAGPWTLAATLWLPRGERAVTDPGARRDLADSLAEGLSRHLADVRRLVPGAQVIVQLDEPALPSVLAGKLPTRTGFGKLPAVESPQAEATLTALVTRMRAAGAGQVVVHSCADKLPYPMLRRCGADAISLDVTRIGVRGWESLAVGIEAGQRLWAGVVPTGRPSGTSSAMVDAIVRPWREIGLPAAGLDDVTITPACGLAGATPDGARAALAACVDVARGLAEVASAG